MFEHFIKAQSTVYDAALGELSEGRKRSHWMWFILPQIRGLGRSPMAEKFALSDLAEAVAYLEHPILGARLRQAVATVLPFAALRSAAEIFGSPDDLKFRSCLTLFARAEGTEMSIFRDALDGFYGGDEDPETLRRLIP